MEQEVNYNDKKFLASIKNDPRNNRGLNAILKALEDGVDIDDKDTVLKYMQTAYSVGKHRPPAYIKWKLGYCRNWLKRYYTKYQEIKNKTYLPDL